MRFQNRIGQAKILTVGCLTEFGERYVFYLLQSLLIFYLIGHLHFTHGDAAKLVGTVIGIVYLSALMGGYIAEHLLSYYIATCLGSILMAIGSIVVLRADTAGFLYVGIAIISISSGLIKSNVASFIGRFYDETKAAESQRDFGFNVFYMGINFGIILATFFAPSLQAHYGFHGAFYSCLGITMIMMLNLFFGFFYVRKHINFEALAVKRLFLAILAVAVYVLIVYFILKNPTLANYSFSVAALLCLTVLVYSSKNRQKKRVIIASVFFILSVLYWSLYMQMFISLLLFLKYCVMHSVLGISLKNSQFLSIESLCILVFSVVMGKVWVTFERCGRPVHDISKFNFAFFMIAAMFAVFYVGICLNPGPMKVPGLFIAIGFLLMAISELSLSAIGLSMVTKIAPDGFVALYMGIWLVTLGLGGKLAGQMAAFFQINRHVVASKVNTEHALLLFIGIALLSMLICFVVRKPLIRQYQKLY